MQTFKIEIKGISPYMQHRMDDEKLEEWEKRRKPIIESNGGNDTDMKLAVYHSYMNSKGKHFIPADHIRGALINGGGMVSGKVGNRTRSMKNIVAGQFLMTEDELPIFGSKMIVDKRSAVNNNNKARIMVKRPKWEDWSTKFTLKVDNDDINIEMIKQIIEYAGSHIGIGSYRPTCKGLFGRFELKSFKKI